MIYTVGLMISIPLTVISSIISSTLLDQIEENEESDNILLLISSMLSMFAIIPAMLGQTIAIKMLGGRLMKYLRTAVLTTFTSVLFAGITILVFYIYNILKQNENPNHSFNFINLKPVNI